MMKGERRLQRFWIWMVPSFDNPQLVLVSDMNDWSPGYGQTFAPHGKSGPIMEGVDPANPNAAGARPERASVGTARALVRLAAPSMGFLSRAPPATDGFNSFCQLPNRTRASAA